MNRKMIAIPAVMLGAALALTGCGGKDAPATSPSPSDSAMMEDQMMEDEMMSPSPSPSDDMMMDDKMSESPSS